jgi:beta-glucosidase
MSENQVQKQDRSIFPLAIIVIATAVLLFLALGGIPEPKPSIDEQVAELIAQMTDDEKFGQMTLVQNRSITPEEVTEYHIGAVLSGGGGYPEGNNTVEGWMNMVHEYQDAALASRLEIPLIYGVDAVHGHNNVTGAVIFPHNIGLGATRNPELVEEIGRVTALEMIATGIYWNYSPVLAVPQDIRWGRTYEGYAEQTDLVTELSMAMLNGLQGDALDAPNTVLGTPKHFVGDGGTAFGTSPQDGGYLDRGVTELDEATLREIHLAPYYDAIENGARSIMISYSSWNDTRMHGERYLITDVLLEEMGFEGFIVSDWQGIDDVAPDYYDAVVQAINAGIDMNMVPDDYQAFIDTLREAVANGDISMERIDEAVGNILRVKFEMGLFERPYGDPDLRALVGSDEHRALAREAVAQSLVLLKNENNALPIDPNAEQTIFIAGAAADNIGVQLGGWSIEWQGISANLTPNTLIRRAIGNAAGDNTTVRYSRTGRFVDENEAPLQGDIGIVIIGEEPYAEWFGDTASLNLPNRDRDLIKAMREQVDTLVVILLSGRPMVIDTSLNLADAFVAAWLPGTEGDGVSDVLMGERDFVGKLPFTWLRYNEQLPFDFDNMPTEGCEAPLFPFGYGLTYEDNSASEEWLALSVECAPEEVVIPTVEVVIPDAEPLAPEGDYGYTYYAPYPVEITLDGDFADWAGVPQVTVPEDFNGDPSVPSVTFASAADDTHFYFFAHITDDNIISGEHGANYWNEDSVEFYINASGDLEANRYSPQIAQVNIPALNFTNPDPAVISGVNGELVGADVSVVQTNIGWAVEASVPLDNGNWMIVPEQDSVLGFQVHLNGASLGSRDTKLIWSAADTGDTSYQNPSVFGQLIFHEVGASANSDATSDADSGEITMIGVGDDVSDEWALVWNDEFDGDGIDSDKWIYDTGGTGFGNNELQYYTTEPDNSYIEDGNLVIVAREQERSVRDYTSAKLWTLGTMSMQYGRVDVRARLPQGQGIWPAVWMLPTSYTYGGWPHSGEIDIMEMVGHEPATVHGTLHYSNADTGNHTYTGDSYTLEEGIFADNFHVFSVIWEEGRIEWYVDGELYQVQEDWSTVGGEFPAPFDQEFYLIINMAVGGDWPQSPDETTVFPQMFYVDYVRIYEEVN